MEYIGIDVHKRDSQVCILGEGGEVVLEQRVRTQRERLGDTLVNTSSANAPRGSPAWSKRSVRSFRDSSTVAATHELSSSGPGSATA
jgi:hypothetical protein